MKDLIRKILKEEVQKRYFRGTPIIEMAVIRYMDRLMNGANRVVNEKKVNYGNLRETWCKNGKEFLTAIYYFEDGVFQGSALYIDEKIVNHISQLVQARKTYILNVIAEWYDEKYTTKFGQEQNSPELEIEECDVIDFKDKDCPQEIVVPEGITREEMIDYIVSRTSYRENELEELDDEELRNQYITTKDFEINR
jgi:hypothetical protein